LLDNARMGGRESGELRCSDAEREAAVTRLRDATGEGRLALEELAERVEAAYAATTRGDLAVVTDDLPARAEAPVPAQRDDPAPAAPTRRRMLGIMGGHDLRGPMRLEPECRIVNVVGGTDLDLTQAHLEEGEVTIRIFSLLGGSTIRCPTACISTTRASASWAATTSSAGTRTTSPARVRRRCASAP
jgi:hypothetical protein